MGDGRPFLVEDEHVPLPVHALRIGVAGDGGVEPVRVVEADGLVHEGLRVGGGIGALRRGGVAGRVQDGDAPLAAGGVARVVRGDGFELAQVFAPGALVAGGQLQLVGVGREHGVAVAARRHEAVGDHGDGGRAVGHRAVHHHRRAPFQREADDALAGVAGGVVDHGHAAHLQEAAAARERVPDGRLEGCLHIRRRDAAHGGDAVGEGQHVERIDEVDVAGHAPVRGQRVARRLAHAAAVLDGHDGVVGAALGQAEAGGVAVVGADEGVGHEVARVALARAHAVAGDVERHLAGGHDGGGEAAEAGRQWRLDGVDHGGVLRHRAREARRLRRLARGHDRARVARGREHAVDLAVRVEDDVEPPHVAVLAGGGDEVDRASVGVRDGHGVGAVAFGGFAGQALQGVVDVGAQ